MFSLRRPLLLRVACAYINVSSSVGMPNRDDDDDDDDDDEVGRAPRPDPGDLPAGSSHAGPGPSPQGALQVLKVVRIIFTPPLYPVFFFAQV